jgi:hypothetical protein
MSDPQTSGLYSFTQAAVMAHPSVIEPKKFKRNGKETGEAKYSASFVLKPDSPDFAGLKASAIAVAKAKWPGRDIGVDYKAGTLKFPWAAGDKLAERRIEKRKKEGKDPADDGKGDFMKGFVVVKSSSKYEPGLAVFVNGKPVDLEGAARALNKNQFYFGVEVVAQLNFVAYDGIDGNPDGVTAYLQKVLTFNRGKKLSSGGSAAEVFKGVAGVVSNEDPTGGEVIEDEIPF